MEYYIEVLLPLPLDKLFTYRVSDQEYDFLVRGMRVAVPFKKSGLYTGLVWRKHHEHPGVYEPKDIDQIIDEVPVVSEAQLQLWEWIASYYLCSLGEVFRVAVPAVMLLESETLLMAEPELKELPELDGQEEVIWNHLQHRSHLKVSEVADLLDRKQVMPVLNRMAEKRIIRIQQEIYDRYRPKMTRFVRLHPSREEESAMHALLDDLGRAHRQREVMLRFFSLQAQVKGPIPVKMFRDETGAGPALLKTLTEKQVLEVYSEQVDRTLLPSETLQPLKVLNEEQEQALKEIRGGFSLAKPVLLHGVTSSGKTEVYAQLIREVLDQGKQVLYLVPEIGLTTQLLNRLKAYFGDQLLVYHSRYTVHERLEVWYHILGKGGKGQLIIGARSAVLLPYSDLGLIIVDEEHEPSYKQFDPAPRYHARDTAVYLAALHRASVLLGSATPSLESYYNARTSKYALVQLLHRFGQVLLPDIELTDLKEQHRKKRMKGHFSERLREEIQETLDLGLQVILFQNRRGYAPVVECGSCGHVAQCPNCDVSLTLHQRQKQMRCHYCGYQMAMQQRCVACGSAELDHLGFGTEQVEQELMELFPQARVARMDADTTRGKFGFEKLFTAFASGDVDILVGTQMVAKGLDFDHVRLVGIMQADTMLHYPDFRAPERCYQLVAQVSGRAGRAGQRGKVIVQTFNPYHQILQQASANQYEQMYLEQMEERRQFHYPPFYRLIHVTMKCRDLQVLNEASAWKASALRTYFESFAVEVLGPEFPAVARVRNEYIRHILIKIGPRESLGKVKLGVKKIDNSFTAIANFRKVKMFYDVDRY